MCGGRGGLKTSYGEKGWLKTSYGGRRLAENVRIFNWWWSKIAQKPSYGIFKRSLVVEAHWRVWEQENGSKSFVLETNDSG